MRNISDKVVEKLKKHVLLSITFFLSKIVPFVVMWKNILEANKPQMKAWHMSIACWIPKATNTHSRYLLLFQATHFMNTRGLLIFTLPCSI